MNRLGRAGSAHRDAAQLDGRDGRGRWRASTRLSPAPTQARWRDVKAFTERVQIASVLESKRRELETPSGIGIVRLALSANRDLHAQLDNAGWHGPENLPIPDGIRLVYQPPRTTLPSKYLHRENPTSAHR